MSDEEFLLSDFMQDEMDSLLKSVNANINSWEYLYQYRFIFIPPTVVGGELTPTMQLKRKAILEKYKPIVCDIYDEEAA